MKRVRAEPDQVFKEACTYCHTKQVKMLVSNQGNVTLSIGKLTVVEYYDDVYEWQSELFEFAYCPMCGQELQN